MLKCLAPSRLQGINISDPVFVVQSVWLSCSKLFPSFFFHLPSICWIGCFCGFLRASVLCVVVGWLLLLLWLFGPFDLCFWVVVVDSVRVVRCGWINNNTNTTHKLSFITANERTKRHSHVFRTNNGYLLIITITKLQPIYENYSSPGKTPQHVSCYQCCSVVAHVWPTV